MDRKPFLDAVAKLPEEEFNHLVAVVADVAKRLPEHQFGGLAEGEGSLISYDPPDPEPTVPMIKLVGPDGHVYTVEKYISPNDVTVGLTGVEAVAEKGGLG